MPDEPKELATSPSSSSPELDLKDPVDRSIKKWMKRLAYIAGALGAIILPLALLFNDVKDTISSKTKQVDSKTTAGYEVMAKAVTEIQDILTKTNVWAKQVESDKSKLVQVNKELETRIIKLEAYVDVLITQNTYVRQSRDPRISNPVAYVKEYPAMGVSKLPSKPEAPLPADINTAQQIAPK